jgi:hypothetical protein
MATVAHKPVKKYDGPTRIFLQERGSHSPNFVIAVVKGANRQPGWSDFDDITQDILKADGFEPVSIMNDSAHVIPMKYLDDSVEAVESRGELKHLEIQDLPTLADFEPSRYRPRVDPHELEREVVRAGTGVARVPVVVAALALGADLEARDGREQGCPNSPSAV